MEYFAVAKKRMRRLCLHFLAQASSGRILMKLGTMLAYLEGNG